MKTYVKIISVLGLLLTICFFTHCEGCYPPPPPPPPINCSSSSVPDINMFTEIIIDSVESNQTEFMTDLNGNLEIWASQITKGGKVDIDGSIAFLDSTATFLNKKIQIKNIISQEDFIRYKSLREAIHPLECMLRDTSFKLTVAERSQFVQQLLEHLKDLGRLGRRSEKEEKPEYQKEFEEGKKTLQGKNDVLRNKVSEISKNNLESYMKSIDVIQRYIDKYDKVIVDFGTGKINETEFKRQLKEQDDYITKLIRTVEETYLPSM